MSTETEPAVDAETESQIKTFVKDHPRLAGTMMGALLLLMQAGQVAGKNADTVLGP